MADHIYKASPTTPDTAMIPRVALLSCCDSPVEPERDDILLDRIVFVLFYFRLISAMAQPAHARPNPIMATKRRRYMMNAGRM